MRAALFVHPSQALSYAPPGSFARSKFDSAVGRLHATSSSRGNLGPAANAAIGRLPVRRDSAASAWFSVSVDLPGPGPGGNWEAEVKHAACPIQK